MIDGHGNGESARLAVLTHSAQQLHCDNIKLSTLWQRQGRVPSHTNRLLGRGLLASGSSVWHGALPIAPRSCRSPYAVGPVAMGPSALPLTGRPPSPPTPTGGEPRLSHRAHAARCPCPNPMQWQPSPQQHATSHLGDCSRHGLPPCHRVGRAVVRAPSSDQPAGGACLSGPAHSSTRPICAPPPRVFLGAHQHTA